jgi:hypothetical protein
MISVLEHCRYEASELRLWKTTALSIQSQSQSQSRFTTDSQSVSQSVSQYVLVPSPLCGRLTRYCFLFKCLGLKFDVVPLGLYIYIYLTYIVSCWELVTNYMWQDFAGYFKKIFPKLRAYIN